MSRLILAVATSGVALSLGTVAAADCGGPSLQVRGASELSPGDEIVIRGGAWGDSCNDTPGGCRDEPPLGRPLQDIRLRLRNEATLDSFDVGVVDADEDYAFEVTIRVPKVPPGTYLLTAGGERTASAARLLRVRQ